MRWPLNSCHACFCEGPPADSDEKAIERWNARAAAGVVAMPPASWANLSNEEVLKIAPMMGSFSADEVAAFCGGFRRCAQTLDGKMDRPTDVDGSS